MRGNLGGEGGFVGMRSGLVRWEEVPVWKAVHEAIKDGRMRDDFMVLISTNGGYYG